MTNSTFVLLFLICPKIKNLGNQFWKNRFFSKLSENYFWKVTIKNTATRNEVWWQIIRELSPENNSLLQIYCWSSLKKYLISINFWEYKVSCGKLFRRSVILHFSRIFMELFEFFRKEWLSWINKFKNFCVYRFLQLASLMSQSRHNHRFCFILEHWKVVFAKRG